jgi:hypothetical protein
MKPDFWDHFVDTKQCGGYLLRCILGSTERSAVYLTRYGEEPASLKLTTELNAPAIPDDIRHPNLIRQLETGTCDRAGVHLRYLVMEHAEENLASAVASRALSSEETRELLTPVVNALVYLHGRGFVHGRVKPSNILAKGDIIKLTTDSLRPADLDFGSADDMRDVGLTLIEVLTQRREAAAIPPLDQPFRDIVEHTLHPEGPARWTAQQVAMRLAGKVPPARVPPAPKPAQPAEALVTSTPASSHPQAVAPRTAPIRFPRWALPAAGVVMLLAVVFVLAHGPAPAPVPPAQPQPAAAIPQPQPPKPAAFDPPKKVQPIPLREPKPARVAPSAATPAAQGWFVVVASYAREVDARQRAESLARRFPQFRLAIFPPSPIDLHYLVILGSGLTQPAAQSLRDRAVASGLPHDTYIKRYPGSR